jgi:hypothetical protein
VEVVRVLYHVCEALEYAHDAGVVHRDIKPANILRSGSYSMITDFGVAKALNAAMPNSGMTSTGMAVGTPAYMAPEQLAGDATADHRIDIYALGLMAYELLYGKSPFAASTPQRVLAAVLTQEPTPLIEARPDVPAALSELVMRCLSKEPENRPANAREVLDSLDMFSTASGEIRTMEHRVPRSQRITPNSVPRTTPTGMPITTETPLTVTPSSTTVPISAEQTAAGQPRTPTPQEELLSLESAHAPSYVHDAGYIAPKKSRSKYFVPIVGVLVLAAAGAFFMSQGDSTTAATDTTGIPKDGDLITDTAAMQAALPAAVDSTAVAAAPIIDSTAIKDSIRKARREAAAKRAALDSLKKASQPAAEAPGREVAVVRARVAAQAMLSDAAGRKAFMEGATHKGGVLGTQRKGDLQTQIDALTPFLSRAGMSYDQFKSLVRESGINLFDQFGRMLPSAMEQFASNH